MTHLYHCLSDLLMKLLKWMNSHINVVDQVSKVVKWNKDNQQMEPMYTAREEWINILSHVDFSKMCHLIQYFPELNQKIGQENITFLFYSGSRDIEWRNRHLIGL